MHIKFNILIFIVNLVLITKTKSEIIKNCPYKYTVDLTESVKLENNSYIFNYDTLITPDLVQDYDFKILDNGTRINNVEPYKRGCICAVKKCMTFCTKRLIEYYQNYSSPDMDKIFTKSVKLANGKLIEKHLIHDFYPIFGREICKSGRYGMLLRELYPTLNWTLYEDGVILRHYTNTNLTQNKYCFDAEDSDDILTVNPVFCSEPRMAKPWYKKTALISSIPFFILIMLIYSFSSNVKTVRGKCFITYLFLVTLTYSLITFYHKLDLRLTGVSCQTYGFVRYYTQIGCLTWSCILCYDVWNCLTHMAPEQSSFRKYFIIGFSMPLLVTLLGVITTLSFSKLPEHWLCTMFVPDKTIIMIFYDLPSLIVAIYTWISYMLIILYSRKTKKEQAAYFHEIQRPKLERMMVYIRILISMGFEWTILFCLNALRRIYEDNDKIYEYIVIVDTFVTTFQGLFIFLIFIWDSRVRTGIRKRSSTIYSSIRRKFSSKRSTSV